jgi:hypothetical protein
LTGTGTARLAALARGQMPSAPGAATLLRPGQARGPLRQTFAEAVQISRSWSA